MLQNPELVAEGTGRGEGRGQRGEGRGQRAEEEMEKRNEYNRLKLYGNPV